MSTKYKTTSEVPSPILIVRLQQLSDAIPKQNRDEFSMRVPAECDRDADLVISEAARRLEQLQATNQQLLEFVAKVVDTFQFVDKENHDRPLPMDEQPPIVRKAMQVITNAKQREA